MNIYHFLNANRSYSKKCAAIGNLETLKFYENYNLMYQFSIVA